MKRQLTLAFVLLLTLVFLATSTTVQAAGSAELRLVVKPARLAVGQEMTVKVLIKNAPSIYGADVRLTFDPQLLEVVDADASQRGVQLTPGDFLDPAQSFALQHQVDNTSGTIDYALTLLNPAPAVQGDGQLAQITFRAKSAGQTSLSINQGLFGNQQGETITPALDTIEIRITAKKEGGVEAVLEGLMDSEETGEADSPLLSVPVAVMIFAVAGVVGLGIIVGGGWYWWRRVRRR